jgi:hypothetical protein
MTSRILVSLRVAAPPGRAFDVVVREILALWRANGLFQFTPHSPGWRRTWARTGAGHVIRDNFGLTERDQTGTLSNDVQQRRPSPHRTFP